MPTFAVHHSADSGRAKYVHAIGWLFITVSPAAKKVTTKSIGVTFPTAAMQGLAT